MSDQPAPPIGANSFSPASGKDVPSASAVAPRLSIVVPAYNLESFLSDCLQSIDEQSEIQNLEVIVIDDSSTDATVSIMNAWSATTSQPHKLIFNEHNLGAPTTFNKAIRASSSALITIIDGDDLYMPQSLLKHVEMMEEASESLVAVYGDCGFVDERGVTTGHYRLDVERARGGPFSGKIQEHLLRYGSVLPVVGTVFRRNAFEAVGGFDGDLIYCDWPLWLKMSTVGEFRFSGIVVGSYRQHPQSMSATRAAELRADRLKIIMRYYRRLGTNERGAAKARLRSVLYGIYRFGDRGHFSAMLRASATTRDWRMLLVTAMYGLRVPPRLVMAARAYPRRVSARART